MFGGYQSYIDAAARRRRYWEPFQRVPRPLRRALGRSVIGAVATAPAAGASTPQYVARRGRRAAAVLGRRDRLAGRHQGRRAAPTAHLRPDAYDDRRASSGATAERERPGADLLQKMTYLELKLRLAELLLMRVDKMTMATSVEARVPFLDHELVAVRDRAARALQGPRRRRQAPAQDARSTGSSITTSCGGASRASARRSRSGSAPSWARRPSARSAARRWPSAALIDYDHVDELWAAHRAGQEWSFQLWNLYNVSAWYDHWVAGRELVA